MHRLIRERLFAYNITNIRSRVKVNFACFDEGIHSLYCEYVYSKPTKKATENMKRVSTVILDWLKTGLVAVVVAILINSYVLQAFQVKGESMLPTLENADSTFALKLQTGYNYGDIVIIDSRIGEKRSLLEPVMEHPLIARITGIEHEYMWVKRVIGLPGDTLEFRDGGVFRNGKKLEEPYIKEPMRSEFSSVTVPEDHVFVMGDNRNYSTDSRRIGSIPLSNVIGKVIFSY